MATLEQKVVPDGKYSDSNFENDYEDYSSVFTQWDQTALSEPLAVHDNAGFSVVAPSGVGNIDSKSSPAVPSTDICIVCNLATDEASVTLLCDCDCTLGG